jgi:hypothetical protein
MANNERNPKSRKQLHPGSRALIEIAFIVFLFYSNLLMGEFTGSNGRGKSWAFAMRDIVTEKNFGVAIVTAVIGYFVFEALRRKV